MEKNKTYTVKAIFTNLLFVVGIILMVVGFVSGTSTLAKLAFFEVYPLQSYEESRCDAPYYPVEPTMIKTDGTVASESAEAKAEREKQIDRCKAEVERGRSVKKVEDVVFSISFFVAGTALALVFKQFIFQKK
jgi:hypothetical protein